MVVVVIGKKMWGREWLWFRWLGCQAMAGARQNMTRDKNRLRRFSLSRAYGSSSPDYAEAGKPTKGRVMN